MANHRPRPGWRAAFVCVCAVAAAALSALVYPDALDSVFGRGWGTVAVVIASGGAGALGACIAIWMRSHGGGTPR
jgi:hypothetical protein